MDDLADVFERHRPRLIGLAYRMLGTTAEDVVQDVYLKWHAADRASIRDAGAWLTTVCTRLALNRLESTRAERERYVGPWLPEPFASEETGDASERVELDETISVALLVALERLTPGERAAYLLHDVFDYPFDEIAGILDTSSASARQLASRARRHVREARPRFRSTPDEHERLLDGFLRACREGDMESLLSLLAPDAEFVSDGGGKAKTILAPLRGAGPIADFFLDIWRERRHDPNVRAILSRFNGAPGVLVSERGIVVLAIGIDVEGSRIARLYAVRNPDKLVGLQPATKSTDEEA